MVALVGGGAGGGGQVEPLGLRPPPRFGGRGEGQRAARRVRQGEGRRDAVRAQQEARVVGGAEVPREEAAEGRAALRAGGLVADGRDAVAARGAFLQAEAGQHGLGRVVGDVEEGGGGRDRQLRAGVQGEEPQGAARVGADVRQPDPAARPGLLDRDVHGAEGRRVAGRALADDLVVEPLGRDQREDAGEPRSAS